MHPVEVYGHKDEEVSSLMENLIVRDSIEVRFGRTERPYEFNSPFAGDEFALLLFSGEDTTSDEQTELSEQIVRQGCRYAVCGGIDCVSWDDSIDWVCIMDEIDEGISHPLIMTTWHDKDSIDEVVEYFALDTRIDGHDPKHFMVLLIGGGDELEKELKEAILRWPSPDERD